MKAKLILFFLLITHIAYSQSIQEQVRNYTNTRADLISKSRALLLDKFLAGDMASVRQITNYIVDSLENKDYLGLYSGEKMLIYYYTHDYDKIIDEYNEADSLKQSKTYLTTVLPNYDFLFSKLQEKTIHDYEQLADNIDATQFSIDKKGFLQLSLQYLLKNKGEFISQQKLNELANKFLDEFPNSEYNQIVKDRIRIEYVPSDWAWGFGMYGGYGIVTGKLSEYYTNPGIWTMNFDLGYKRFYASFDMGFRFFKVKKDIPIRYKGHNYVWPSQSSADGVLISLDLGYSICDSKRIRLIPYALVGFSGAYPLDDDKEEFPELKESNFNGFAYGAGFNFDIKLGEDNVGGMFLGHGYWILRLRYSYTFEKISGFKGGYHSLTLGFAGWGGNMRLKK